MESGHFLIQLLREKVHVILVLFLLDILQEIKLRKRLVGERTRHDEGRVAGGTAQIQQAATSKNNDTVAIREFKAIDLGLDVLNLDAWEALKFSHLDFIVKVADVSHDGIVLHLLHVLKPDNVEVTCCCDKDIHLTNN